MTLCIRRSHRTHGSSRCQWVHRSCCLIRSGRPTDDARTDGNNRGGETTRNLTYIIHDDASRAESVYKASKPPLIVTSGTYNGIYGPKGGRGSSAETPRAGFGGSKGFRKRGAIPPLAVLSDRTSGPDEADASSQVCSGAPDMRYWSPEGQALTRHIPSASCEHR
ncbi:hypothetical protein BV25DRAFT_793897 [Artomyces pyxidatus]|uniref:Uncharacterized protein n=1 Tax=Artomyces pyxidatus TaxID=48021 RepID=A0ACB8SYS8_9AGAM|nr:hypothetical protein BV25DRAFT_793897 [Artomyces pyxidatus]